MPLMVSDLSIRKSGSIQYPFIFNIAFDIFLLAHVSVTQTMSGFFSVTKTSRSFILLINDRALKYKMLRGIIGAGFFLSFSDSGILSPLLDFLTVSVFFSGCLLRFVSSFSGVFLRLASPMVSIQSFLPPHW